MNHSTSVNNDGTNKCCEYKFVTIQKYFIDIGIVTARRCATCSLIDLQLTLSVKYLNSIIKSPITSSGAQKNCLVFLAVVYRLIFCVGSRGQNQASTNWLITYLDWGQNSDRIVYIPLYHTECWKIERVKTASMPAASYRQQVSNQTLDCPFHWCREFKKHAPCWFRFYWMDYFALSLEFYLSEVICWCYWRFMAK